MCCGFVWRGVDLESLQALELDMRRKVWKEEVDSQEPTRWKDTILICIISIYNNYVEEKKKDDELGKF